jgi:hypothetical protein
LEQTVDSTEKKEKPPSRLLLTLAGGLLFGAWYAFLQPWVRYLFWQSDTFWLIETGRLILAKQCLPAHDPYSFASSAPHWMHYQWLTEVIFAVANTIGGLTGVAVLGEAMLAILFCVLVLRRMILEGSSPIIAIGAIWLSAYSFYPDLCALRPQLFSFILFWLLAMVCADIKLGMPLWKAVARTFVITAIWANCHLSFMCGLLVLLSNFGASLSLYKYKNGDKDQAIAFGALVCTFVIATLFTPYRFALWGYIGSVHNLYYTQEVQPLAWANQPLLIILALASLASCLYLRKKSDFGSFMSLLSLAIAGSICGRLIVYFCIFTAPVIAEALTQLLRPLINLNILRRLSDAMKSVVRNQIYIYGILLVSTYVVMAQPIYLRKNVPVLAARFLADHPLPGNLFCTAHTGSYLIYSLHGRVPVFMDTRMDLFDAPFVKRFADAFLDGTGWKELFAQYKIAAALLPNGSKLQLILDGQADWKQVYKDPDFSLYIQSSAP